MRFKGMPVVQAVAILVALFGLGLPTSVGAQSITTESLRAINPDSLSQLGGEPKRLMPATGDTLHQAVRLPRMQRQRRSSTRTLGARLTVAALMGFVGAWAGAEIGGRLESNCRCDDPGLKGALIGMPIGAAAGVTLGLVLTR